jgi:hypothetical protein
MSHLHSTRARVGILLVLGLALSLSIALVAGLGASRATENMPPPPTARPTDLGASLITQRTYPSLSYGIQAFLWWNQTTRPRDLELVRLMRFDYVKQIFDWNDIRADANQPYNWEHADAVVREVQYRKLKLIARIGKPPYWVLTPSDPKSPFDLKALATFCHDLAARYKGQIAGYQVWNEPNLAREWQGRPPNPAGYVAMLRACYTAIKEADPNAVVISAGLATTGTYSPIAMPDEQFLTEMYRAGFSAYYDVLGLHAPGYKSPPETPPDDPSLDGNRWMSFRHVEDMRAIQVANGDGKKQIAILEVGWTTDTRDKIKDPNDPNGKLIDNPYRWHAVTDDQQAEYLVRAYEYAAQHWRPWVGLMVTIYLPDVGWTQDDEEYWWAVGLPGYNFYGRRAFTDLADMARYTDDQFIPARKPGTLTTPLPAPK